MVTQHELIESPLPAEATPLLREAVLQIADPQVRYLGTLGTVGGNVANGDPGNDMPGLMQCLDARLEVAGPEGARTIPARAFYHGAYETARAEGEILTRALVPVQPAGHGYAYEKQKRKIGDYATAAAAVTLRLEGGRCAAASVAMTNLADRPVWSEAAGAALVGSGLDEGALAAAVASMQAAIEPVKDNRDRWSSSGMWPA
jgi:carbon-monoxide dehydrogenase medium subunit